MSTKPQQPKGPLVAKTANEGVDASGRSAAQSDKRLAADERRRRKSRNDRRKGDYSWQLLAWSLMITDAFRANQSLAEGAAEEGDAPDLAPAHAAVLDVEIAEATPPETVLTSAEEAPAYAAPLEEILVADRLPDIGSISTNMDVWTPEVIEFAGAAAEVSTPTARPVIYLPYEGRIPLNPDLDFFEGFEDFIFQLGFANGLDGLAESLDPSIAPVVELAALFADEALAPVMLWTVVDDTPPDIRFWQGDDFDVDWIVQGNGFTDAGSPQVTEIEGVSAAEAAQTHLNDGESLSNSAVLIDGGDWEGLLHVTGNYYEFNTIVQVNLIWDNDTLTVVQTEEMGEGGHIKSGDNAQANKASIVDFNGALAFDETAHVSDKSYDDNFVWPEPPEPAEPEAPEAPIAPDLPTNAEAQTDQESEFSVVEAEGVVLAEPAEENGDPPPVNSGASDVAAQTTGAEPTAAAESAVETGPTAAAEPAVETEPTAAAEPAAEAEPTASAESAVEAEPMIVAEPVDDADPQNGVETAVIAADADADPAEEDTVKELAVSPIDAVETAETSEAPADSSTPSADPAASVASDDAEIPADAVIVALLDDADAEAVANGEEELDAWPWAADLTPAGGEDTLLEPNVGAAAAFVEQSDDEESAAGADDGEPTLEPAPQAVSELDTLPLETTAGATASDREAADPEIANEGAEVASPEGAMGSGSRDADLTGSPSVIVTLDGAGAPGAPGATEQPVETDVGLQDPFSLIDDETLALLEDEEPDLLAGQFAADAADLAEQPLTPEDAELGPHVEIESEPEPASGAVDDAEAAAPEENPETTEASAPTALENLSEPDASVSTDDEPLAETAGAEAEATGDEATGDDREIADDETVGAPIDATDLFEETDPFEDPLFWTEEWWGGGAQIAEVDDETDTLGNGAPVDLAGGASTGQDGPVPLDPSDPRAITSARIKDAVADNDVDSLLNAAASAAFQLDDDGPDQMIVGGYSEHYSAVQLNNLIDIDQINTVIANAYDGLMGLADPVDLAMITNGGHTQENESLMVGGVNMSAHGMSSAEFLASKSSGPVRTVDGNFYEFNTIFQINVTFDLDHYFGVNPGNDVISSGGLLQFNEAAIFENDARDDLFVGGRYSEYNMVLQINAMEDSDTISQLQAIDFTSSRSIDLGDQESVGATGGDGFGTGVGVEQVDLIRAASSEASLVDAQI